MIAEKPSGSGRDRANHAPLAILELIRRTRSLNLSVPALPGAFSVIRILCVPIASYLISTGRSPVFVFWLVLGAALTDYIDGWVALRMKCKTYGGKILDFSADKIFLIVIILSQASAGQLEPAVAGVIAGYHLLVILAMTVLSWGIATPIVAMPTGEKLVVILSYVLVVAIAGHNAFPGKGIYATLSWILGIITILSLVVGIWSYLRLVKRILERLRR